MNKNTFAPLPPMGWNSYDYYDTAVTEADVRANAAYMAEHLKKYGWKFPFAPSRWMKLLTNEEVLSLRTPERQRRQVLRSDAEAVWVSRNPADGKTCAALFNLSDDTKTVSVPLTELELSQDTCRLRDLWDGKISRCTNDCIQAELPPHGCALYAIEA